MSRESLRKTVPDVSALCAWASTAPPRDFVVYHIGNLVTDRIKTRAVGEIADTVHLLQEMGWLVGSQQPMRLAAFEGWTYIATRTGAGRAPASIIHQRIQPMFYRAILAVQERPADMSVTRCIRDAVSVPETFAKDILAYLFANKWVEEGPNGGWKLTRDGSRMLS